MMATLFYSFTAVALPWMELPDSLDTLTTMAAQIQNIVSAAIGHPVWAIAAILFSVVLLQILADLIKRVLKTSVAFVLKLPLTASQWIWQRAVIHQPSSTDRVEQLIARLDELRQEQDDVVAELKELLSVDKKARKVLAQSRAPLEDLEADDDGLTAGAEPEGARP